VPIRIAASYKAIMHFTELTSKANFFKPDFALVSFVTSTRMRTIFSMYVFVWSNVRLPSLFLPVNSLCFSASTRSDSSPPQGILSYEASMQTFEQSVTTETAEVRASELTPPRASIEARIKVPVPRIVGEVNKGPP
jgi:hypothetical protein